MSKPKNRKLLAKHYKISESRIESNLNKDYKRPGAYTFYKSNVHENYLYEYYTPTKNNDTILFTLKNLNRAFKVNVQRGYKLIDRIIGLERNYWPATNTATFDKPIAANSKDDIDTKVLNVTQSKDFTERISFPSSSYQLKEITMAKIVISYRNHILGENIVISDSIKKNRYIIDFPETDNKCVFFCIAYHLSGDDKSKYRRMISFVKPIVKKYCDYKNIEYTSKTYKEFQAIDIMQFDELKECVQLRIKVYEMSQDTLEVSLILESKNGYSDSINILMRCTSPISITFCQSFRATSVKQFSVIGRN